ncbi:MAG: trpD [Actinomycetia bacterium]|nr:trpD [Actinomycetes bacterium]
MLVQSEPDAIASLGPTLAGIEGIAEVYSVAGDADLVAILRTNDHEAIAKIVTEQISPLPGIRETRTLIAFRQYDAAEIGF